MAACPVGRGPVRDARVVWLRAAIVLGAGSTSYEMLRYLADRLPVLPLPSWLDEEKELSATKKRLVDELKRGIDVPHPRGTGGLC